MNKSGLGTMVLMICSLAACAAGPDYRRPATPVPERFARTEAPAENAKSPQAVDTEFWRSFNDPLLSSLIDKALSANNDLRVALARYDSEEALLRGAKFDRYPTITMNANAGHQQVSEVQAYGFPRSANFYGAGVDASWELDVFGRVRRDVEAHRAEAEAVADDLQALQISIVGQVADAYIDLRGAQERLRVARSNADNQRETLSIVNARIDAGRGSNFDAARARAQFESTASRVPVFEAQIAVDEHRLAVLTGRPPEALIGELDTYSPLPTLPARIDPNTPGDLLRRRPDIAAAEQHLHASTARIGIATYDLFPRLSLSGMLGTYAFHTASLLKSESETSLVALGIDWSFLDVGRVRARIAASNAEAAGLLSQYQQAVFLALEDTENALVRYAHTRSEDEYLEHAANDSATAAQLAHEQFQAGAIGVYEVLDAERIRLQAQDAFADGRMRSATAAIALYKALAGGWPQHLPSRQQLADSAPLQEH